MESPKSMPTDSLPDPILQANIIEKQDEIYEYEGVFASKRKSIVKKSSLLMESFRDSIKDLVSQTDSFKDLVGQSLRNAADQIKDDLVVVSPSEPNSPERIVVPLQPEEETTEEINGKENSISNSLNSIELLKEELVTESPKIQSVENMENIENNVNNTSKETELPKPKTKKWFKKSHMSKDRLLIVTPQGEKFEIASARRNNEFHEIFPEIDKSDALVDDYSCAWFNDILLQGRLYVSENNLAFYSKVIWKNTVVIPLSTITMIEKKSVAGIFQNAIEISTLDSKNFFASFVTRDNAYRLLTALVAGHPCNEIKLKSDLCQSDPNLPESNPPSRQNTFEKIPLNSKESSGSMVSLLFAETGRRVRSDGQEKSSESLLRITSSPPSVDDTKLGLAEIAINQDTKNETNVKKGSSIIHQQHRVIAMKQSALSRLPKTIILPALPNSHPPPFECTCASLHSQQKLAIDTILPIPLAESYHHIFSNESVNDGVCRMFWEKILGYSSTMVSNWMSENEEVEATAKISPTKLLFKELKSGMKRKVEYTVPLNNPLGPKTTRCRISESVKNISESHLCIDSVSQTPDVPSGDCFQSNLRICLLYQTPTSTRLKVSSQVVFLKSTWLKMVLLNAVPEGVKEYWVQLAKHLEKNVITPAMVTAIEPENVITTDDSPETAIIPSEKTISASDLKVIPSTNTWLVLVIAAITCLNLLALAYIWKLDYRVSELESSLRKCINVPSREEL